MNMLPQQPSTAYGALPARTSLPLRAVLWSVLVVGLYSSCSVVSVAQEGHSHGKDTQAKAPRVFLDKPARIVEYQLKRLSNAQLLLIETAADDKKYLPVFNAILSREGMSASARQNALKGLVAINGSNPVTELVAALQAVKASDASGQRIASGLAEMLLDQNDAALQQATARLIGLTKSSNSTLRHFGFAGLIAAGDANAAWDLAQETQQTVQWLEGVRVVPSPTKRSDQHARVMQSLESDTLAIRRAAIETLASIDVDQAATFSKVAAMIDLPELRPAVVQTLLGVPTNHRGEETSIKLIKWLVDFAEQTDPAQRTSEAFLQAMALVDQLLAKAPASIARAYRSRLGETVVRVVPIHTVEEEMRYDIEYFAAEAGRPVQVVLINEDLMPHNLVITRPGALQEVADLGLQAGPNNGVDGKQYVPDSEKVLFATNMIAAGATERLTFTAPAEPGEYPYVCTFPRHWMRMYGVMVVVDDLDQWNASPVAPKDPIGSNRSFVESWTTESLGEDLEQGLRGRSPAIGERLFVEATCAQCHKAGQHNTGNVGPDLSEVFNKWKGDATAVLREILDPSHTIDDKYAVHLLLTVDGETFSGLVVAEDDKSISILANPEAESPMVLSKDDIEDRVKTSTSMMPKGLLDRFSKDEIYEIIAYIKSVQKEQ